MLSVSVYTLGCKLNQVESEALAAAFAGEGFPVVPWADSAEGSAAAPGILIVNTCTVTSKADQKSRRVIRKALRDNPRSCVLVVGCYAQLDPGEIESLEAEAAVESGNATGGQTLRRRLFVVKTGTGGAGVSKSVLLTLPGFLRQSLESGLELSDIIAAWLQERGQTPEGEGAFRFRPDTFTFHTRAFLKVQDGCDSHCAYCRVHLARGPNVSLPAAQVLAEVRSLEAKGYAEVVLTGVNLTQYRDGGCGLAGLLEHILANSRSIALRLSSLEPEGITETLVSVLSHERVRPHFHLSVQSGSAETLKRMGRRYSPETVEAAATRLRAAKNKPFLACDIITGFPGETEGEFGQTLSLCRTINFAWIHAFPYSKRAGTPASSFENQVSEREAVARVETLLALARQGRRDYTRSYLGCEVAVLVERGSAEKGYCRGVSDNYLKLLVKHTGREAPVPGTVLRCRIEQFPPQADAANGGEPDCDAWAIEVKA